MNKLAVAVAKYSVTFLDMSGSVGDSGVRVMADAWTAHGATSLRSLNIRNNNVGDDGLNAIAAAMTVGGMNTLTHLNISDVDSQNDDDDDICYDVLTDAVGSGRVPLSSLSLAGHGYAGLEIVTRVVLSTPQLAIYITRSPSNCW